MTLTWWDTFTRGTPVEYRHPVTGEWTEAVTDAYRASDNSYVLVTRYGTASASTRDVRSMVPCQAFGKGCGGRINARGICNTCHAVNDPSRGKCWFETTDGNRDDPSSWFCGHPTNHAGEHGKWEQ